MTSAPDIPQSSPPLPTQLSSGGTLSSNLALSPGTTGSPSAPGGGGDTLQDCMNFWDAGTHMTKAEWRGACKRTLARIK